MAGGIAMTKWRQLVGESRRTRAKSSDFPTALTPHPCLWVQCMKALIDGWAARRRVFVGVAHHLWFKATRPQPL